MQFVWPRWMLLGLCALLLAACSSQSEVGSIILVVDADDELVAQLTRLEISGSKQTASLWLRDPPAGRSLTKVPFSVEVLGPGTKTVRIRGYAGEEQRIVRLVTLSVVPGKRSVFHIFLSSMCVAGRTACMEQQGLTCDCGDCVPIAVTERLQALDPRAAPLAAYEASPLMCPPPEGPAIGDGDEHGGEGDGGEQPTQEGGLPDAGQPSPADGGAFVGGLRLEGPSIIAAGRCRPITLVRQDSAAAASIALSVPGGLIAATDSQCAVPVSVLSFAAGQERQTFYVQGGALAAGEHSRELTLSADDAVHPLDVRRAAVSISAGDSFACAMLDDLSVQCWGSGERARLGRELTSEPVPAPMVGMPSLHDGARLKANGLTTYVLDQGALYSWGDNQFFQLGRGTTNSFTPGSVSGLESGVTQMAAGYFHACAVRGGDAYCWGRNDDRQAGNVSGDVPSPRKVSDLPQGNVLEVAAADVHSCALLVGGEVRCWGGNASGQLGDGTTTPRATPVSVDLPGSRVASHIWAELESTCALIDDKPYCWGHTFPTTPVLLSSSLQQVDQISPAFRDVICLRSAGKAYCQGDNRDGWLGTGSRDDALGSLREVPLPGELEQLELSYAYGPTFTAIVDGVVYTWGLDGGWTLGVTPDAGCLPTPKPTSLWSALDVESMRLYEDRGCVLVASSGEVACWGRGGDGALGRIHQKDGDLPEQVLGFESGGRQLSLGVNHVIAVRDGKVSGWGDNRGGQLGVGYTSGPLTIVDANVLPTTAKVAMVSAGMYFSCALVVDSGADNGVFCWGTDLGGSLGDPATHESTDNISLSAIRVYPANAAISDIHSLGSFTCVAVDGGVQCWGDRVSSQVPVSVPGLEPGGGHAIVDVELGGRYGCARSSAGDVYCWDGGGAASKVAISGVEQLQVGGNFACARTSEELLCWNLPGGTNECGQLGLGDTLVRTSPTRVDALVKPVEDFALYGSFACARDAEGWKCWGSQRTHLAGFTPWVVASPLPVYRWGAP